MSSWAGDTIFCPGGSIYSVRQTVLNVHCSKNSHYQEGTVLISTPDRRNPCSYVIDVYTSVGCPTKKPVPVYDCVFKDTFNGWVYDLSSENANKHSPDGFVFFFFVFFFFFFCFFFLFFFCFFFVLFCFVLFCFFHLQKKKKLFLQPTYSPHPSNSLTTDNTLPPITQM